MVGQGTAGFEWARWAKARHGMAGAVRSGRSGQGGDGPGEARQTWLGRARRGRNGLARRGKAWQGEVGRGRSRQKERPGASLRAFLQEGAPSCRLPNYVIVSRNAIA